jgi:5'-3' exoribonuclease 1
MVEWDKEVFEKDYGDMNWFKGKQSEHLKATERARKRNSLVLTSSQSEIFEKVQKFVLQQRDVAANGKQRRLDLQNNFPARDREFITTLAKDLNLELAWDEYDEHDQNLVTFRPPGMPEEVQEEQEGGGDAEAEADDEDWTSDEEDEEARDAVDRVLDKYRKAKVVELSGADFDERYEQAVKDKMDEWKRSYYMVRPTILEGYRWI